MRNWQDEIFDNVTKAFGFARTGPRRERKSREEYLRQQDDENRKKISNALKELRRREELVRDLDARITELAKAEAKLAQDRQELERHPQSQLHAALLAARLAHSKMEAENTKLRETVFELRAENAQQQDELDTLRKPESDDTESG
jgi:uncharacterized protein (DUF3084 family)